MAGSGIQKDAGVARLKPAMVKMTAERMRLLIDQAKRVIRAPQRATHFFR